MKIIYIANVRLPTEKAHGLQIMKMCQAFSLANIDIELLIPWRFNPIKEGPFDYYGVDKIFKIKKLFSIDLVGLPFGFWIQSFSFSLVTFFYLFFKKADFIYSRDLLPLFFLSLFKKNLVYEVHYLPGHFWIYQGLLKRVKALVVITQKLKELYQKEGISQEKILVAPDGVDLDFFQISESQEKCRQKLNLPQDKKIVLYTGHLYRWKGVATLLKVAQNFQNILFVFVGGTQTDIKNFKFQVSDLKLENVLVVGHRPHQEIPFWLKAADVLILPNSAKEKISQYWTSPMKMFEYMAVERPIVASDLPSIREVLNENNAILVEPDNPQSLAQGIEKVLKNLDFSTKISNQALKDVQKYTWSKRVNNIIKFICAA